MPDPGVCSEDELFVLVLLLLSSPAAAIVAATAAEAIARLPILLRASRDVSEEGYEGEGRQEDDTQDLCMLDQQGQR